MVQGYSKETEDQSESLGREGVEYKVSNLFKTERKKSSIYPEHVTLEITIKLPSQNVKEVIVYPHAEYKRAM